MPRRRMSAPARRLQLIEVGRQVFAEKGLEGTSVEELAVRAGVTKPVIYEHFGGKEGLYQAVIDKDMASLDETISQALQLGRSRLRIERAVMALLDYAEKNEDGFRILARDGEVVGAVGKSSAIQGLKGSKESSGASGSGVRGGSDSDGEATSANSNSASSGQTSQSAHNQGISPGRSGAGNAEIEDSPLSTLLGQSVNRASHVLAEAFHRNGLDPKLASLYAQGMVGAVAMVAQWWTVEQMKLDTEATTKSVSESSGVIHYHDAESEQKESHLPKDVVAAHVVNLLWNGLAGMEKDPELHEEVEGEASLEGVRLGAGKDADPAEAYRQRNRRK